MSASLAASAACAVAVPSCAVSVSQAVGLAICARSCSRSRRSSWTSAMSAWRPKRGTCEAWCSLSNTASAANFSRMRAS